MGNSVEKRTIAQFVHDAVEMETAIYTLKKTRDKCVCENSTALSNSKNALREAESDLRRSESELSRHDVKYHYYFDGEYIGVIFGRGILASIVVALIFYFVGIKITIGWTITLSVILGLIISAITVLPEIISENKSLKSLHDNEIAEFEQQLKEARQKADYARIQYDNAEKKDSINKYQINEMKKVQVSIEENLKRLYEYGIIPPDYRYMDCVIILDQIFRNDLADTMREAIKIYEERVFRGSVIRGMDKICSMLGQLSSDMSAISLKLDMINNNVAHMSGDLERFNQRIASESAKNRAATEELIKETQLGRYTNEKLLESNKRLEYYAEEYRMGRMPIR